MFVYALISLESLAYVSFVRKIIVEVKTRALIISTVFEAEIVAGSLAIGCVLVVMRWDVRAR
jgi:hypothetical protein